MKEIGVNYSHQNCWLLPGLLFLVHLSLIWAMWLPPYTMKKLLRIIISDLRRFRRKLLANSHDHTQWTTLIQACLMPIHMGIMNTRFIWLYSWMNFAIYSVQLKRLNEITCTYHCLLDLVVDCNCTRSRSAKMRKKRDRKWNTLIEIIPKCC